jgi:hypothetical protein
VVSDELVALEVRGLEGLLCGCIGDLFAALIQVLRLLLRDQSCDVCVPLLLVLRSYLIVDRFQSERHKSLPLLWLSLVNLINRWDFNNFFVNFFDNIHKFRGQLANNRGLLFLWGGVVFL